jgi:hypothetical protein
VTDAVRSVRVAAFLVAWLVVVAAACAVWALWPAVLPGARTHLAAQFGAAATVFVAVVATARHREERGEAATLRSSLVAAVYPALWLQGLAVLLAAPRVLAWGVVPTAWAGTAWEPAYAAGWALWAVFCAVAVLGTAERRHRWSAEVPVVY